jgi:hypothetical protein
MSRHTTIVALLLTVAACSRDRTPSPDGTVASTTPAADSARKDSIARARQDSINRAQPGYVIDSILPVEEMLRRFRAKVGGTPVTALQHASPSRDALIARFLKAVAASDSSELRAMALNAREFADLVYPESPNTKPPYKEDPALMWMTIQNPSQSGYIRLVRRTDEIPTKLFDYRCTGPTEKQGRNTFTAGCVLRLIEKNGETKSHRYFGSIIERDHKFKIVSYRNEF